MNYPNQYQSTIQQRFEMRARVALTLNAGTYLVPEHGLVTKQSAKNGVCEAIIYASDIEKVQADVEDKPELIAAAQESYMRKLRADAAKSAGVMPAELEGKSIAEWPEQARITAARHPGSTEAEFFSMTGRGVKPLSSVVVLESDIAPPLTQEQQAALLLQRIAAGNVPAVTQPRTRRGTDAQ